MANVKNSTSPFKLGDRVFIPNLQQSGEIIHISQEDNPYIQGTLYYVVLDSDRIYQEEGKNQSALFREWHLVLDAIATIQLKLL